MNHTDSDRTIQFKPTPAMIAAAQTVFMAMALNQMVEPVVNAYKREILAQGQWRIGRHQDRLGDRVVTEPKDSYLLSDADFAQYDALCKQARDRAGLQVDDPEQCPLLVAEHELMQARQFLVKEMQPTTGVDWEMLARRGGEASHKYMELTLHLLAPFCKATLSAPQQHWLLAWRDHVRSRRAVVCPHETDVNTCNRPGRDAMEVMDCVRCNSGTQQNRFAKLSHRITLLARAGEKVAV